MTSARLELEQLAYGVAWPVRALAAVSHAVDPLLRSSATRRLAKAAVDFSCAVGAVVAAVAVGEGLQRFGPGNTATLAILVGVLVVGADTLGGSYRTIWRYTSLKEAMTVGFSSLGVLGLLLAGQSLGFLHLSGATSLLIALLLLFLCVGVRTLRRWSVADAKRRERQPQGGLVPSRRVIIAGAGEHGLSIGRELMGSAAAGVELVGFLDDDPAKHGAALSGVPVLGPLKHALALAERHRVSEVIVAMPSAHPDAVRTFGRQLEEAGVRVRAVRGIERFVLGGDLHRPGSATLRELLDSAPPVPPKYQGAADDVRRVLVTGGAGFIGSHLTRMLLERGYHVRVLDRFDYGHAGLQGLSESRLEIITGDICNSRDVSRAARDVYGVIALAAIVGDPACNLDPEETINLNYAATKILAETCNFYGVRRLVFASSCSVYGSNSHGWLTERSRLNPVSLYARTRVLSENILLDRRGDVEPVILRLATVFGLSPRMRYDLVVNTLTARAVADQRITVMGGNQWRPNVHCRDAARAFTLALEAPGADVAGETFNLGGDSQNYTINQLGEMVARIVGDVEVVTQGDAPDPRDYRVSFEKIRRGLGFEPQFSVEAVIREITAAMRADPALQRHQ